MTRHTGPIRLAIRSASTTPALSVFATLIVGITAFAGAAAPGLLQQVQSDSLHYALAATDPSQRDFVADTRGTPIPASGGRDDENSLPPELRPVWGGIVGELADARAQMDPKLSAVLAPARVVTDLDPAKAVPLDPAVSRPATQLSLRWDPELSERVTWVEGAAPASNPESIEFGLTADVAEAMGWTVGEARLLPRPGGGGQRVLLSGVFEPVDAADPDWRHAPIALEPGLVEQGLAPPLHTGTGYAAPDDLETPLGLSDFSATTAWYPLDVDAVEADDTRDLVSAMRLFTAITVDVDVTAESFYLQGLSFGSTAPVTMTQALVRIEATTALVSLIASGPLAVAIVVLTLTARMLALRRRTSLQLAQARGASARLRGGLLAVEGLLIGAVGAVAGGVAGGHLGATRGAIVALVPVIVGLTPAVALPVLGLLVARRRVRADLGSGSGSLARWRLVVEVAVVVLAGAALALVLSGARSPDVSGVDPLVTMLPLLLSAVGCVVTLRVVPLLLALVERAAARGRGLIGLVGPARARRDPAVRVAPVLAVVVGVAIAVFAVAFSATVDSGIRVAARSTVGADLRVSSPYINEGQLAALANLDGVRATAPVYADEQRPAELPASDLTVTVFVIDIAEVRRVQTDPDASVELPDSMLDAAAGGAVPVLASADLADRIGDDRLSVAGVPVEVVATAPAPTPLGSSRNWIAVDRSLADRLVSNPFSPAVVLVSVEPGADAGEVADEARSAIGGSTTVETPSSVSSSRLQDPALLGLQGALLAAVGVVALLLALAIGMTLVLGAPARGRLLALLSAVGFRRSRELALVVWEVAPAVVVALPVGALIGLALPFVVVPALDLTGFVGGAVQPIVRLGGLAPLYVVGGFLVVTVLAVLVAALVARRVTAAGTLRSIDEEG